MAKAKGWVVICEGSILSLCVPNKQQKLPKGVDRVLFISTEPTVFSSRGEAQKALALRKEFDELNGWDECFLGARVVALYEPK